MSGKHIGVQNAFRILINLNAKFLACTIQTLHLAGLHVADDEVHSVTFFRTLERLYTLFYLCALLEKVNVCPENIFKKTYIRWSARGEAKRAVKLLMKVAQMLHVLTQ